MKDLDVGFFKTCLLKLITKLQEFAIKNEMKMYLSLSKYHFKVYFGKDLVQEVLNNTKDSRRATKRHGNMVVSLLYKDSDRKKEIHRQIVDSYCKTLILEADL